MKSIETRASKRILIGLVLACSMGTACGGTYSNEDIEYQTAVPNDIAPTIAAQIVAGSAESYKWTYGMVQNYRAILGFVSQMLDHVRRYPATQRHPDARVWGPFNADEHPGFQLRVKISRVPPDPKLKPTQFTYSIDFGSKASGVLTPVIFGTFDPEGGLGEGGGQMTFDVDVLRAMAFPFEQDLKELRKLEIIHTNRAGTRTLSVQQTNTAEAKAPKASLVYSESPDHSATTRFVLTLANLWTQEVDVVSAWRADGSGRGEIKVTAGLATGSLGIDCWGPLTLPTFVKRDWDPAADQGDPASCVLPALR